MDKTRPKRTPLASRVLNVIGCLLLIVAVVATGAGNYFAGVLDTYVGVGKPKVTIKEGAEGWDAAYYTTDYHSPEEIDAAAKATTKEIAGEGITLLKNQGQTLPLTVPASLSLFGRRSVDTVLGGTGSGAGDGGQCTSLADALTESGFQVNEALKRLYLDHLDEVTIGNNTMDKLSNMTYYIGEFPQSYYSQEILDSYQQFGDAALVVFGRQGGEGMDFCSDLKGSLESGETAMSASVEETRGYEEGQHQLELSLEERELLSHVKEHFEKVIVIINSANVMELGDLEEDEGVDAILWMAYPGSRGTVALAEILKGEINPSGHTVDTWPADLTASPTFPNTTTVAYENTGKDGTETSYTLDYEEGIYLGYRYYETAAAEGVIDYDSAVVYPFGHGLSYTTFSQKIKEVTLEDGKFVLTIAVANTGSVPGKDVLQLYYHAPYTGSIEKAEVVLAAYSKTDLLMPGESRDYPLSFALEDMASYDYKNAGAYVLEAGTYTLSLRKNSHELYGEDCTYTYEQKETLVYGEDMPRQTEVEAQTGEGVNLTQQAKDSLVVKAALNQFEDMSAHFAEYDEEDNSGKAINLSRKNLEGSFPKAPTKEDLTASGEVLEALSNPLPDYIDPEASLPTTGAKNGVNAVALRGLSYDDPLWDLLLDQLSVKDMTSLIYAGNQGTISLSSLSLPSTTATDGPAGLKQYGGLGLGVSGNFNCCGTLVAATWNEELARAYGVSVGNEAVQAGVGGWYAPGLDLHRTAFGGRNFEYYSEDPLISGKTCAATISGAASKGLVCYFKHFALNDVETHREDNAPCIWANEQALRELYLRAFEVAVKEPMMELKYLSPEGEVLYKTVRATTGIMSSFNRIGSVWTGGSIPLMTNVLRGEWGFCGTVITDYNDEPQMHVEAGVVAGNDLMLANAATLATSFTDTSLASTQLAMRRAVKNIVYSIVNSNAVNGLSDATTITYGISPWRVGLYIADAALVALALLLFLLARYLKKRPDPATLSSEEISAAKERREAIMKKLLALVAVLLVVLIGLTLYQHKNSGTGGSGAPARVYTSHTNFVEAGYEGDCINTVCDTLVLNPDGSYTLANDFIVNQVSGIIVFSNTTYYEGTYEVVSEDENTLTVSLSDATSALSNAAGITTSSQEDASLLEGCKARNLTCDKTSGVFAQ